MEKNTENKVNTDLFTDLIIHDYRISSDNNIVHNRNFEQYDLPMLEACSRNKDKEKYSTKHLIQDLSWFFNYLPKSELNRFVRTFTWLFKEALKNYGYVQIPELGKFITYDRPSNVRYNISTGERYKTQRMKLKRKIEFKPSPILQYFTTPRDTRYMRFSPDMVTQHKEFPDMFNSFVYEVRHRRSGKLLFQDVFDTDFRYLGYSDAYIQALYNGELYNDES